MDCQKGAIIIKQAKNDVEQLQKKIQNYNFARYVFVVSF
jgi:hypothetical protein